MLTSRLLSGRINEQTDVLVSLAKLKQHATAGITGAFVALHDAVGDLLKKKLLAATPIRDHVAAVSVGVYQGVPVLDLDYDEDSNADADANFVLIEGGQIAEAQATAEGATYDEEGLLRLLRPGRGLARPRSNWCSTTDDERVPYDV